MPNIHALRKVREQRGLDITHVATFAAISVHRLADFERGEREPSRKQVERLAETYGVPLYSLFGDAIPNLPPLPQDFRKRDPSPASLTPRGVKTLLMSERTSQFGKQLAIELGYKPANLLAQVERLPTPKRHATEIRAIFDAWYRSRAVTLGFSGSPEQKFFSAFRLFIEVQGGVLQVNDAPPDDYMGFFLKPDAGFPTIFVNRSIASKKAQLFTLAHEYSHALLGEEGISNPFRPRNATERACNVFAAEFLAPMDEFSRIVEALPRLTRANVARFIDATSSATLLSKHAAAIRLVEGNYISQNDLRMWRRLFTTNPRQEKDEERDATLDSRGHPHAKRIGELGYLPVVLAKRAVDKRLIDSFDVVEGLGLSHTLQERAFALAARRFDLALS